MNNNLRNVEKTLRAFSKRCKNIKYTKELLFSFLMTGSLSYGSSLKNDGEIEKSRKQIENSVVDMKKLFREAKRENNKLLKQSNLELVQLMEQGDHVVKSPWSSWQFGMNYFYSDWRGTYKGRGDKAEKYPYEGIFSRSLNLFERSISPASSRYSEIQGSSNPYSASSSARQGLYSNYGIASTIPVSEPIISFELSAGVNPRTINKNPITVSLPNVTAPSAPSINVNATTPTPTTVPTVTPPTVSLNIPKPNTSPFNDYSFSTSSVNGNMQNGGTYSGQKFAVGWDPVTNTYTQKSHYFDGTTWRTLGYNDVKKTNVIYLNRKTGTCRTATPATCTSTISESYGNVMGFTWGGTAGNEAQIYAVGNTDTNGDGAGDTGKSKNVAVTVAGSTISGTAAAKEHDGVIGMHIVWNGSLHDIRGYLKGNATMFALETWHAAKVAFQNVSVDVAGDDNTIFYIYPSNYGGIFAYASNNDYNSFAQRGALIGNLDVNIASNGNAVYSVMGVTGSYNLTSNGIFKLEGSENVVYSGLGYAANFENLVGKTGSHIVDMYKTGMTPRINLATAPESYGDDNVILFFGDHTITNGEVFNGYQTLS